MYRKLYLAAFLYLGATFIAGFVIAFFPGLEVLSLFALLGMKLALALGANELYRWHCRRLVARMQARHPDQPAQVEAALTRRGGTSAVALGLGILVMFVITFLAEA